MKRALLMISMALLLVVSAASGSENLAKPYALKAGEVIALFTYPALMSAGLNVAPVLAFYDKDAQTIDVAVYGTSSTVDGAKQTLEKYRAYLTGGLATMVEATYGVKLGDADFTLIYYDRSSKNKERVRFEGGEYVIK
jgi:hypothetical protein